MANLKNINFMSKERFDSLAEVSDDELYAVKSHVVVETYQNGTEWYRVYSDGWIEQGGLVVSNLTISGNSSQLVTIDLLREFKDEKYFVTSQKEGSSLGVLLGVKDKTKNNFVCVFQQYSGNSGNTDNISWFACGMGV